MSTGRLGPRVAIVGTNDPRNVSGGRYHAVMLAHAVAACGGDAHLVMDHVPGFMGDLAPLAPGGVQVWQTPDFAAGLPAGGFDWVVVVPTGIFLPGFYDSCRDFAARAGARLALLNFESGNWFNAAAPAPRDPRIWDDWRRICLDGALVLCSARVAVDFARNFYTAPEQDLRFEIWSPPVNSFAARHCDGLAKDGSIVAFVRPTDLHKGADLLLRLDPACFAGRTLRLIAGCDVPCAYRAAIASHLRRSRGASLEIGVRISDRDKFRWLTRAQAVLFPSRFEGFGYPPVEAAYAGTESVCFDLPVLRETVGAIARFAPTADLPGFETALAAALAAGERRRILRDAVRDRVAFEQAALRLQEILTRSADRVRPVPPRAFRTLLGPPAKSPPIPADAVDRAAAIAAFPPHVVDVVTTSAGEILITGRAWLPACVDGVRAVAGGGAPFPAAAIGRVWPAGGFDTRFFILAPPDVPGRRVAIRLLCHGTADPAAIELVVERAGPASALRPAVGGISETAVIDGGRRVRGWVLAREPVTAVWLAPQGTDWLRVAVTGERRDLMAKFPNYGTARCEFTAELPAAGVPDRHRAVLFCVTGGPGQERAIDAMVGWPPTARPHFTGAFRYGAAVAERRSRLGTLQILDRSDPVWTHGIARVGGRGRLGAILVCRTDDLRHVVPGAALRFADGSARAVVAVQDADGGAEIVLDGPLRLHAIGAGATADVFAPGNSGDAVRTFTIEDRTDDQWWRGVWNRQDHRFRRGFSVRTDVAAKLGLATGARLRFASSGLRQVIDHHDDDVDNRRLWLDGAIRPLADGAPNEVALVGPVTDNGDGLAFSLARAACGWPGGILAEPSGPLAPGRAVLLDAGGSAVVRRGVVLGFAGATWRRVLSVTPAPDGLVVVLDGTVDVRLHGDPAPLAVVDEIDMPSGIPPPYRYPNAGLPAKDPLYLQMARQARRRGEALLPVAPAASSGRVLLLSAVAPSPANQGNRVVTRNLIRHLVACGFGCDVVVQNGIDCAAATAGFGDAVRVIAIPFPSWQASPAAAGRKIIRDAARSLRNDALDARFGQAIADSAGQYHPYFIVRDETVDVARALYATTNYAAVICNYTHLLRVAEELRDIRPLPPVAVVTHDALSRLPAVVDGRPLDLMYRACPAALERDVLDAVPGAVIVAISRSEADYFAALGVANPIVVAEYDAAAEMHPHRIDADAFGRRVIIFHGSANPMNIAGMDWFVDACWASILAAVPDARLVVCGSIGANWSPAVPGLEVTGELPRAALLARCAGASMTINPCVAGTGLKIKTVEAACLGLPAVCLPPAVDGLEDMAARFALTAQDGPGFAAACVALLTDRQTWLRLHRGALDVAGRRFSAGVVYQALDAAMGWTPGAPRRAEGRRPEPPRALAAAAAALEAGAFWQAAIDAASAIAQRPDLAEGYLAWSRAMLGCGLPQEAEAALLQARLVASKKTLRSSQRASPPCA